MVQNPDQDVPKKQDKCYKNASISMSRWIFLVFHIGFWRHSELLFEAIPKIIRIGNTHHKPDFGYANLICSKKLRRMIHPDFS